MLTTKITESSEETDLKAINKAQEALKPIYANILKSHQDVAKSAKTVEDPELKQLAKAVQSGLHICHQVLNDKSSDVKYRSKTMRSAEASYKMSSAQSHNIMQSKRVRHGPGYELYEGSSSPSSRTPYQERQRPSD